MMMVMTRVPSRGPRCRLATALVLLLGVGGAVLAGCARPAGTTGGAPPAAAPAAPAATAGEEIPPLLSATGLYAPDGTVDPRNLPFVPQYPLWSDGAAKSRWIRIPEGARIDVSDIDAWRFPAGTRIWKEFAWAGRRVETRLLWTPDGESWRFAAYLWRADGSDAELAPPEGVAGAHEVAPGKWHAVPGRDDCLACHGTSRSPVLGFSALQLSDDRDPLAPHTEPVVPGAATLASLDAAGLIDPPRPDLVAAPPRIRARGPVERAALGYLSANCGGCHDERGALARVGLGLLHEVGAGCDATEPALRTAVDVPCRFDLPGAPPGTSRLVVPGDPGRSAIVHRMRSRSPSSQMPPLGTKLRDDEAVALVERWIAGLGEADGARDLGAVD